MSRPVLRVFGLLVATCAVAVGLAAGAVPAQAEFGVRMFDGGTFGPPPPGDDPFASGAAYTQAGGHPYEAWTAFEMNRALRDDGGWRGDGGNLRNVRVDLPPGLIGNPTAVPQCPKTRRIALDIDRSNNTDLDELCAPASVVGLALITIGQASPARCRTTRRWSSTWSRRRGWRPRSPSTTSARRPIFSPPCVPTASTRSRFTPAMPSTRPKCLASGSRCGATPPTPPTTSSDA